MSMFRQGDVLLVSTSDAIGEKKEKHQGKDILAWGEVTGHHHRFETPKVSLYADGVFSGGTMVEVKEISALIHEEHEKISVPPGRYRQAFQMEYTPKALKRVLD